MVRRAHLSTSLLALLLTALWTLLMSYPSPAKSAPGKPQAALGSESCAKCHAAIFQTYIRTPMANASGLASDGLISGEFRHSGIDYHIYIEDHRAWLSFVRSGDPLVTGRRELRYFIGSGRRGRTYLFSEDGFLFESPINWYAERQLWDMTPAYQDASEMPMTLPAHTGCLACHTSGVQAPYPGAENRYPDPPFLHAGITCQRCHGPGTNHASADGNIVNPAKLDVIRRDDICFQCHLEGDVSIEQPSRQLYEFQPGERLAEYVRYFVFQSKAPAALSEVEAFEQSACKRKSGAAMSCTSCHNPHFTPSQSSRITYYREKCLACHGNAFGNKHHSENPDCVACHMPRVVSSKIAHTQQIDHRILRRPDRNSPSSELQAGNKQLTVFPDNPVSGNAGLTRDLALAYESVAQQGDGPARLDADRLIPEALRRFPNDPLLLASAGFIAQNRGKLEEARQFYERALRSDPYSIEVAGNLGVIDARHGQLKEAVSLWQDAFERSPGRSEIGINLALAFCGVRQFEEARTYIMRVLQFNPDMRIAKLLLQQLNHDPPRCSL